MLSGDLKPLILAQEAGRAEYKTPGEHYYTELQANHILRCLHDELGRTRSTYDDNPQARLRRHTLITGPVGVAKSSMARKFLTKLAGCRPFVEERDSDLPAGFKQPTMVEVDGDSQSYESIRGSASPEGEFMKPVLRGVDYLFASELTNFLGTERKLVKKRSRSLCRVLEEGQMVVRLVKFASASHKKVEKFLEKIEGTGIHYNEEEFSMWYDADITGVFCSTPLETEDDYDYMESSGLLTRTSIREYNPSEKEERAIRRRQFGKPDLKREDRLRDFNLHAFNCRVKEVPFPPLDMVYEIVDYYHDWYERICSESGLPIRDIANPRDFIDAAQLLTIRAATRDLWNAYKESRLDVDTISYENKDVEWVKRYRVYHLDRIHTEALLKAEIDETRKMENFVVNIIKKKNDPRVTTKELVDAMKQEDIPQSTAYRKVGLIKRERIITGTGDGAYIACDDIQERAGISRDEKSIPEGVIISDDTVHDERESKKRVMDEFLQEHGVA